MAYRTLIYEPGPVARVVLNRPERLNAQSRSLLQEMDEAFAEAVDDPQVRVIVLSGAGRSFSSGHDVDSAEGSRDRLDREKGLDQFGVSEQFKQLYVDTHLRWRNLPKPTVAMVHGYCIYGGWMIAAAMDVIFASDDALFIPTFGDYFTATWDVGVRKAKEIVFENSFLTAEQAMQWGFVNRVYPSSELERETMVYAQRVAESSSSGLRTIKHTINFTQDMMGFTNSVWSLASGMHRRQPSDPEVPPATAGPSLRQRVQRALQYLSEDKSRSARED